MVKVQKGSLNDEGIDTDNTSLYPATDYFDENDSRTDIDKVTRKKA
jgi:hypothetical protein